MNPQQFAAATHGDGPLLILAGAGSGKTRVLTHRIAHLVREGLARPPEILAVTFTNKAAGELRERVEHLVGPEAQKLWVATFHAASARILRREAESLKLTRDFTIYDDGDQLGAVKRVCADLDVDAGLARQYLARIDRWKNAGLLPEKVRPDDFDIPGKAAVKVYARYQKALQAANAVDFGDLIVRVSELFEKFPEVKQRYASRFRHVLVDEFQDTNPAQYHLLRLIAGKPDGHGNLCVVGDDDQSIYRWRGAEVDNILDFEKHFAGTMVVKLEQNYRSSGNILGAAHAVIEKNQRRSAKKLWTAASAGEKLHLVLADDERDEGGQIAQQLYTQNARGTGYSEMAVFYRANAQSRALEDQLRARRIPYRVVRGRSFYDRAEVKDVAAYLRLCVNPRSDADLLRVINVPARGIGDTTVEGLRKSATSRGLSLWEAIESADLDLDLSASAKSKLGPFRLLLGKLRAAIPTLPGAADALELVLASTGYEDRLRLEGEEGEDRIENLHELVGAARDFDRMWSGSREAAGPAGGADRIAEDRSGGGPAAIRPPGGLGSPLDSANPKAHVPGDRPDVGSAFAAAALEDADDGPSTPLVGFLEQLALVGDADAEGGGERVSLMTLHAAKGLEFDAVWLTGLEERVFPSSRSLGLRAGGTGEEDEAEIAEERRLCYVGMTRARKRLTLTLARCRTLFGELKFNPPSRFLRELPPDLVEGYKQLDARGGPAWARDAGFHGGGNAYGGGYGNNGGGAHGGGPAGNKSGERVDYDFDQRPPSWGDDGATRSRPPPLRPMRESRSEPLANPPPRQAAPGMGGMSRGAKVRHPKFGVGTVEATDGIGLELKLTVRFAPPIGEKKILARFLAPA